MNTTKKITLGFIWFSAALLMLTLVTGAMMYSKSAKSDTVYAATASQVENVQNVVTSPWIVEVVDTTIFRNSVATNSHFIVFRDKATAEEFTDKVNAESRQTPVGKKFPVLRRTAIRTYIDF